MQALVAQVLAAWREAERAASQHQDGRAHDLAVAAAARLRELYELLVDHDGEVAESDNAVGAWPSTASSGASERTA